MMMTDYYELVLSFEEYPGNYERELTQWVFGAQDEYMRDDRVQERPHAASMDWSLDSSDEEGKLIQFAHEEYGMVWSETLSADAVEFRFCEELVR